MRNLRFVRVASLLSILLVAYAATSCAQTFNLDTGREPVSSLDGLWRFQAGDDPQWANPGFDDSQWKLLRSDRSWTEQGYPRLGGFAWYRFTVQVQDGSEPLGLLLTVINTGYQVYANGNLIGSAGSTEPTRYPISSKWQKNILRIPEGHPGPRTIQVALRVWTYQPFAVWLGGGMSMRGSAVGYPASLTQRLHWYQHTRALREVNGYTYALLASLVGLTVFGLFLFRREDREYLWFAILLLAAAADAVLNLVLNLGSMPFPLCRFMGESAVALSLVAALVFFSIVLKVRRSWTWWIGCIAAAASPLTVALFFFQLTGIGVSYILLLCCRLPAYLWIVVALAICVLRKDVSARLLAAPAFLLYGLDVLNLVTRIRVLLGWQGDDEPFNVLLLRSPFPLYLINVFNYIFILALLIFLVRRFSLARKEEARLSGEMDAARNVQSLLIPAGAQNTPGFAIESVYLPATEVGGDFFHVHPGENGSLLVVVGDVSGKGLKAAMTVSMIVGILRTLAEYEDDPTNLLIGLNRRLFGRLHGGFATCIILKMTSNGACTLANAGHLSPYLNGHELPVAGSLPVGMIETVEYENQSFSFAAGDRLTMYTDGVLEASNTQNDLFGFERLHSLMAAKPSSASVAETACAFGQEDDITVLTIVRLPEEERDARRELTAGIQTVPA